MAPSFKHTKVSGLADGGDSSLVLPSDWNAEHTVLFSATDMLLGRSTAGAGAAEEIPCTSFARSILDDANEATFKATVNLEIGTDVQAFDAFLDDIAALTDPGADRILFWDDSAGEIVWLTLGTNLSISTTTLNAEGGFASGTQMLFVQTSAPTGWTKDTSSHNNKAIRMVTGTASSGGSVAFTTAFASQTPTGTVGGTSLSTAQLASHAHSYYTAASTSGVGYPNIGTDGSSINLTHTSGSTGSGSTHNHSFTGNAINLAVQYVDVILATKD